MSWLRRFLLVALILCLGAEVQSDDCNQNGVEDSLDIQPGKLEFETEHVWDQMVMGEGIAEAVVTGDWNSDGGEDIAAVNRWTSSITVLLNQGEGVLGKGVYYDLESTASCLLAVDLDVDGTPDLIAVGEGGSSVFVLLGRGDGTFDEAVSYDAAGNELHAFLTSDLNGDGRPDIVVAGLHRDTEGIPSASHVLVLLGRGDGTFEDPKLHEVEGWIRNGTVLASDLNGDGRPDLALVEDSGGVDRTERLLLLLSRGDGTFDSVASYETESYLDSLIASDLNGDGKIDLALVERECAGDSGCTSAVLVLLDRGDGTFTEKPVAEMPISIHGLLVSDMTGDGKLDLVAGTESGFLVFPGRGDGTFEDAVEHETGSSSGIVVAADLNGDATPDLVVPGWRGVLVLVGRGDGTFGDEVTYETEYEEIVFVITDLDGDATPDIVGGGTSCSEVGCYKSGVFVLRGRGDGTFDDAVYYEQGGWLDALLAPDLNNDGAPDLVAMVYLGSGDNANRRGRVIVSLGRGDGTFQEAEPFTVVGWDEFSESAFLASDLDGDGAADLVAGRLEGVSVFLGHGDGTFDEAARHDLGESVTFLLDSDLDGDGTTDLVAGTERRSPVGISGGFSVLLGRGDGTFEDASSLDLDVEVTSLMDRDLNGDGRTDLVVGTWASVVLVFLGRGDGTFQETLPFKVPGWPSDVLASDLDGDGRTDLVAGNWDFIAVLLGRGDGTFEDAVRHDLDTDTQIGALHDVDLDGNGFADLVALTRGGVLVLVAEGDGTFEDEVFYEIEGLFPFDGTYSRPLHATDLNGDRKPDLAVATWSNGVHVLLGRGDGTFEDALLYGPGRRSGFLLSSDFDGNGREDLAFSTAAGIRVLGNGTRGPVSRDRDRDGVPDECQERFRRGDSNDDGNIDLSDAVSVLGYLFGGGPAAECLDAADVDDTGGINVTDPIFLLNFLFVGGPAPSDPFGECGVDPTSDEVDCESFSGCGEV